MNERQKHVYLPAVFSAGSFLCLLLIALTTSPINNISYAVFFFVALLILLVSVGHLVTYWHSGGVSPKSRYQIFILSFFILTLIMFRSAQSLSLTEAIVLLLITSGALFYANRR